VFERRQYNTCLKIFILVELANFGYIPQNILFNIWSIIDGIICIRNRLGGKGKK